MTRITPQNNVYTKELEFRIGQLSSCQAQQCPYFIDEYTITFNNKEFLNIPSPIHLPYTFSSICSVLVPYQHNTMWVVLTDLPVKASQEKKNQKKNSTNNEAGGGFTLTIKKIIPD